MSFNKILISTLKKEKAVIILYLCSISSVMLYYYLLYDKQIITYPIILSAIFLMFYIIYKSFVYKRFYDCLMESKVSPQYKKRDGYEFQDVLDVLREVHGNYISRIYNLKTQYEDRDKLLSEWIHNMKTSVAVIELAAEKGIKDNGGEIFEDIAEENSKLQENLEGTLNLFRLEQFSRDYVPEKIDLKKLVNSVVNSKKRNFIYEDVFPKVEIPEGEYIYTDKNWASYVIEQIITNAIKYSGKSKYIYFTSEKKDKITILNIQDEGIGIKKEELRRVFDAFFTGSNGRKNGKSSGIGLYMCRTICQRINSEISINSEEGKGTVVSISYLNEIN